MILVSIDVGSTNGKKFGWYMGELNISNSRIVENRFLGQGETLKSLLDKLIYLVGKQPILVGLEAPLFFEVNENHPNKKRTVDPSKKSFSAGAGVAVAMTCLTHMVVFLDKLKAQNKNIKCQLLRDWNDLNSEFDIIFFETMVEGLSKAKGKDNHIGDAIIAYNKFIEIYNKRIGIELSKKRVFSLIGSAILNANLSNSEDIMHQDCLVVEC